MKIETAAASHHYNSDFHQKNMALLKLALVGQTNDKVVAVR